MAAVWLKFFALLNYSTRNAEKKAAASGAAAFAYASNEIV
jgi:hypothetical protein